MSFSKLPNEIVETIFEFVIDDTDECFFQAICIQSVSKRFRFMIERELITKKHIWELLWKPYCVCYDLGTRRLPPWIERGHNAFNYLEYRMEARPGRPDCGKELGYFLNRITNELIKFAADGVDQSKLKRQYTVELLRALSNNLVSFNSLGNPSRFQESVFPYMNGEELNCYDLKAAAAAVGNIVALKTYAEKCKGLEEPRSFLEAMDAAIFNEKQECISFLLKEREEDCPGDWNEEIGDYMCLMLHKAIEHNKVSSTEILLTYIASRECPFTENEPEHVNLIIHETMVHGSVEIYKLIDLYIPCVYEHTDAWSLFISGFEQACIRGHGDLVSYVLQTDPPPPPSEIPDTYLVWTGYNGREGRLGCNEYWVQDPLLMAAQYSRVSVLEAYFDHNPEFINYPNLLERGIIGGEEPDYHRSNRPFDFEYKYGYRKIGSRYEVAQFLIDRGIKIDRGMIKVTNFIAKMMLAERKPANDFSMTLILLLITLRARFPDHKRLRKQMHVPVWKALRWICKGEIRMFHFPERHDFLCLAKELALWVTGGRRRNGSVEARLIK